MRKIHLRQDHWNDIPETALSNYHYNHSINDDSKWKAIHSDLMPLLHELFLDFLTDRQYQVFKLYYLGYDFTQAEIGEILGISQPTVNQHIYGKIRGGRRIGGAHQKIKKKIDFYLKKRTNSSNYRGGNTGIEFLFSESYKRCSRNSSSE